MTRTLRYLIACFVVLMGIFAPSTRAEVSLHAIFAKNAVLQRDKPLPVWGWADSLEKVTVTLGTQSATTTAGPDRRWRVVLGAQPMSKEPQVLTVKGTNTIDVPNILLGDVWLCSGQSNMTMPLANYLKYAEVAKDVQEAEFPLIRHFGVEKVFADVLQDNVKCEWQACDKKTADRFSAIAFYFARKVHAETGVPIGILRSAAGGTVIECWLSQESFFATPTLEPIAKKMKESLATSETAKAAAIKDDKTPGTPDFPQYPFGEKIRRPRVTTLHNGMIAPLIPCSIRGVVWYQGESNALNLPGAKLYADEQRALIQSWRRYFNDDALPFIFVQLPNYRPVNESPAATELWSILRESQRQCLAIPNTGMAITIDIGEAEDIHPRNEYDAGERLALLALADSYGKTGLTRSGPLFREVKVEGSGMRIIFDQVGPGLMVGVEPARGPAVEQKEDKLQRFALAGADRKWVWADAVIDGNTVVVSNRQVPRPIAVRYAFSSNPQGCNLYNRAGLPASPFRSDDW